ncbi:MAG: hypothetical protein JXP72_00250 [Coriobacteriia bacterium]|nr:hypothetical protein [Coriobacteriia bacterium]
MVARDMPPTDPVDSLRALLGAIAGGLFRGWRRLLTALVSGTRWTARGLGDAAARWAARWRYEARYIRSPVVAWAGGDDTVPATAAAVGISSLGFGILVGAGIALASGATLAAAVIAGLIECAWAGARLAIIVLLLDRDGAHRGRLRTAYLAGLAPYAMALTGGLRLVALVASAYLTHRGLEGAGIDRRDATLGVAWAFGGQLAVTMLGYAGRAVVALLAGAAA